MQIHPVCTTHNCHIRVGCKVKSTVSKVTDCYVWCFRTIPVFGEKTFKTFEITTKMRAHHILRYPITTLHVKENALLKLLGGLGFFCGSNEMKDDIIRKEGSECWKRTNGERHIYALTDLALCKSNG